ncbi:MAG: hypothetical protein PHQ75_14080 [Thermoguttaceae bacterium]|nr:hypothetical protein [Thermoguttaceae bacterium]
MSLYGREFRWYIFQHREGTGFSPEMLPLNLIQPSYQKTIRSGGIGPWWPGNTPLIFIYDAHELHQAIAKANRE